MLFMPNFLDVQLMFLSIIAIHGLGGHWDETWTAENGNNWLRDSIPFDLGKAGINCRVFSYGYNSSTAFSKAVTDITDEAAMMLDRVKGERKTQEERERPMILIAHSLGGILLKKVKSSVSTAPNASH